MCSTRQIIHRLLIIGVLFQLVLHLFNIVQSMVICDNYFSTFVQIYKKEWIIFYENWFLLIFIEISKGG